MRWDMINSNISRCRFINTSHWTSIRVVHMPSASEQSIHHPGTKPLSKPMLTHHQWGPATITSGQFHKRYPNHHYLIQISFKSTRDQWVNKWGRHILPYRLQMTLPKRGQSPSAVCLGNPVARDQQSHQTSIPYHRVKFYNVTDWPRWQKFQTNMIFNWSKSRCSF